jgi:hypothetical protein
MLLSLRNSKKARPLDHDMKPILLQPHPTVASSVRTLRVRLGRTNGILRIAFSIPGDTARLLLAPKRQSVFTDNLWKHTCFEAFVRPEGGEEYVELNFSPSTQWAAYHFDRYREGMRAAAAVPAKIVATQWKNRFELSVAVPLSDWGEATWRLGISAVIEEKDGAKSFWALAHPDPDKPDFHHPDGFTLALAPA